MRKKIPSPSPPFLVPFSREVKLSYLHTSLRQVRTHGQTLAHHHIRVVGLLEGLFQGLQLLGSEGSATAPLLSVLGAISGLQDDVLKCAAVEREERWHV